MGKVGRGNSGDVYEQGVVKTVAGFLRESQTSIRRHPFGAPVDDVRTGSIHLNEVLWPQSPRAESGT